MAKTLQHRGRHTVLPIIGDTLVELRISASRSPLLEFQAADGSESQITIEDRLALRRGECELLVEDSKNDSVRDPKHLAPLLELLGANVTDALARDDGALRLEFSNKLTLQVTPTFGFESWHFQFPRPGRPVGGSVDQFVSITGAYGRLI